MNARPEEEYVIRPPADTASGGQPAPPPQSAAERRWQAPWGVGDCLIVLGLTALAVVGAVVLLGALADVVDLAAWADAALLPLPLAVLAAITVLWVQARHRAAGRLTGPDHAGVGDVAAGLGLGFAAFIAVNVVLGVAVQVGAQVVGADLPAPQPGVRQAVADPDQMLWLVLAAVVVAPIAEEVFFRGMLFQALRDRTGRWPAIIVSAVVFAALHVLAESTWASGALIFFMILPLGVFLAWLFDRRGTLLAPILVHAVFNAATVGVMLLAVREGVIAGG